MPVTYDSIQSTTLSSTTGTISFTSIPSTFTDLRLRLFVPNSVTANPSVRLRFNNDSGTNYNRLLLAVNNNSIYTGNANAATDIHLAGEINISTTGPSQSFLIDIFSYASSSFKTLFIKENQDRNASNGGYDNIVGMWRSTAAISSLTLVCNGAGVFGVGTTATLFGIKSA